MNKQRIFQKIKNYYHLLQAIAANTIYGFPAGKLMVIGVTGTDGKTTTTSLIYHILKSSGKKAAMITSVGAYIGDKVYDIGFHVTTPSPFGLQKYIKKAVDAGMEYLVLETTSHAIDQNRIWGINYEIGVLTNITHEHLDYHKTYSEYAQVKIGFLDRCRHAVVNQDDESFHLISEIRNSIRQPADEIRNNSQIQNSKLTLYSLKNEKADYTPRKFPFKTNLIGDFNRYNCLAAIGTCKELGLDDKQIRESLLTFTPPPGRQEVVYDKDFRVMIDFAHTPNAFAEILPAVRKITSGKLIHVFGSAGKRDHTKRPEMGREAAKYDDVIILTAEDPRDERLEDIIADIESGIMNHESRIRQKTLIIKPDRREAIRAAISLAGKRDTVILTGKSHEKSMNLGQGEEPWDEFEAVKQALKSEI